MPKASMAKNNQILLLEDYVGTARQISAVKSEPVAHSMQQRADPLLCNGILRAYPAHVPASVFFGETVRHKFAPL